MKLIYLTFFRVIAINQELNLLITFWQLFYYITSYSDLMLNSIFFFSNVFLIISINQKNIFYRIYINKNLSSMSINQVQNLESPFEMVANSSIFENSSSPYMIRVEAKDFVKSDRLEAKQESNQSLKSLTEKSQEEDCNSRKDQHILLYFLNLAVTFCISFQNIILVFTADEMSKAYMSMAISISTVFISLLTTYYLCRNRWKILNIYILLDNIFLTQVASSFGFVGFLLVIYHGYWYQIITMMAFPIEIIFFVGNFRIMMLFVKWSKWRVILFKLVLLADSTVIFEIAAYYMSNDYKYTKGVDTELDSQIKDFVLLYIFGLFALFVELYTKMCDIDQTNELKFDYQLKEMEEEKKIQRIRKSVMGINHEVEKARTKFLSQAKKKSFFQVQELQHI